MGLSAATRKRRTEGGFSHEELCGNDDRVNAKRLPRMNDPFPDGPTQLLQHPLSYLSVGRNFLLILSATILQEERIVKDDRAVQAPPSNHMFGPSKEEAFPKQPSSSG